MTRIIVNGKIEEGDVIDFSVIKEEWNQYITSDGTIIKMKTVVSKIVRTNRVNEVGEPYYFVNSTNIVDAEVPESVIKKNTMNESFQ